jgi:hypothetical protein
MRLKIERLSRKEVNTPNGRQPTAWKLGVLNEKVWYSCFANDWNQGWKEGQTIDVEVKQNGNFWNILPPKKQAQSNDDLDAKLSQLMIEILEIKKLIVGMKDAKCSGPEEEPPVPDDSEEPAEEELPF